MRRKNNNYWRKRYKEIEQAANNLSVEYIINLEEKYRNCEMAINNKIEAWYGRAAGNNNVSVEEARRLLNSDELEELKWSVEQYIKAGKKNAASKNFMKELENASAKFHINRLEALKLEVRAQIELATGGLVDDVDKIISDVYKNTFYKSLFEVQRGVGIGFDVSKLNTDYIQKIISKPWSVDGTNFSSKLWGNKLLLINTIDKELTTMVLSGMGPKRTIKNIANVLNASKYAVKRLVLTEQAYFTTLAEKDSYKELGLDAYEVLATLDNRTCEVCGDMDRKHFNVKDMEISVNAPPFHPFCRCTTIPYFEDDDMQQDTLAKRASRDGDGKTVYELPEDISYKDWKKGFVEGDKEVKKTFMPMDLQYFAKKIDKAEVIPATLKNFEKYRNEWEKNNVIVSESQAELVSNRLEELFNNNSYSMRIKSNALESLLDSGNFKNQFETGTSGGLLNIDDRKKVAEGLFGLDADKLSDDEFEKYGYLGLNDYAEDVKRSQTYWYGDVIIHFDKDSLKDRVTYTINDSYNPAKKGDIIAGLVSEPTCAGFSKDDIKKAVVQGMLGFLNDNVEDFNDNMNIWYIELQYHGELTLKNVKEMCFTTDVDTDIINRIKGLGIKCFKIAGGDVVEIN